MFNSVFIDTRMRTWEELVLQQVHFEFFWGLELHQFFGGLELHQFTLVILKSLY